MNKSSIIHVGENEEQKSSPPLRPVTLRDVVKDCGGVASVAKSIGVSVPSVYGWLSQGHLPLSELHGKTTYSDQLSLLQTTMNLTAVEIRRLGLRI